MLQVCQKLNCLLVGTVLYSMKAAVGSEVLVQGDAFKIYPTMCNQLCKIILLSHYHININTIKLFKRVSVVSNILVLAWLLILV